MSGRLPLPAPLPSLPRRRPAHPELPTGQRWRLGLGRRALGMGPAFERPGLRARGAPRPMVAWCTLRARAARAARYVHVARIPNVCALHGCWGWVRMGRGVGSRSADTLTPHMPTSTHSCPLSRTFSVMVRKTPVVVLNPKPPPVLVSCDALPAPVKAPIHHPPPPPFPEAMTRVFSGDLENSKKR